MDQILADKPKVLTTLLGFNAIPTLCFVITSLSVSSTSNAGFNVMLTAVLYILFTTGGLYVLTKSQSTVAIGFLIGCSFMICLLSLMTAVFWGQLSGCNETFNGVPIGTDVIDHYSCDHIGGYRAICIFAVCEFLITLVFTYVLVQAKDEIVEGNITTGYDVVGGATFGGAGGSSNAAPGAAASGTQFNPGQQPIVADL